ncbi:RNA polymerase sigma factor [Alicyclobacillus fodiniaquatilis]|uniref:RNA polymerase sigma factor n=1 Tax=Alicyclobacillus fodiniaquatilis TaxID=1661150 RepID=A0ABW4JQ54_9BACL
MTDEQLVLCAVQGDLNAFTDLVQRYERTLVNVVHAHVRNAKDAEDVIQETLIRVWKGIPQLREPQKFKSWLLQIAKNRCLDHFRKAAHLDQPVEDAHLAHLVNRHGQQFAIRHSRWDEIIAALAAVPTAERSAVQSFYLEGLTIKEIAARGDLPEGTVKRRLYAARHHLRESLERPHENKSGRKCDD